MLRQLWLLLVLEESVMKNVVVNVDLAHFRLYSLSHFLFQTFGWILSFFAHFIYARTLDEIREFERSFVDSSLIL